MSLDDTLAAWAASVRLPDTEAAAIRRAITGDGGLPDARWWRGFSADFAGDMVRSTRRVARVA
jgi:hypothetical protein